MTGYKEQFSLGDKVFPNNVFFAPLAGCSDYPFRKMTAQFKPGLMFCEMVKMDALVRHDAKTYGLLDYERGMHPIGGQICGSKPEIAGASARIIEDLGFDVVDLNCGCPVDKVTKDGSGSGMLKTPNLIGEVISEMVNAVKIPVMVKIRAGWDENSINASEVTKIAESAGAVSICIHGRTRVQAYTGSANWDHIKQAKESAKTIKVIGNGDIFDVESAEAIFEHTKCDAILLSRGSMGSPWLGDDIRSKYLHGSYERKSIDQIKFYLLQHFSHILDYRDGRKALLDMRRVSCWYLKKCIGAKQLRIQIMKAKEPLEILNLIETFDWPLLEPA